MNREGKIILHTTERGNLTVSVRFEGENFWMTQKAIAELFETERSVITKHLLNIYAEEELEKKSTCAKFTQVQTEGNRKVSRLLEFYNLDVVIAVGYRVNSKKATRFRQWATKILHEFTQKGFVLNDELLKNGKPFGKDYFDELLERIREIRASERRACQKIADVFEQCSYDYDKDSNLTREFYALIQNKLHYATTGKIAAERVCLVIAKNCLKEKELSRLNRIVTMFIDYAELMVEDEVPMSMADWLRETDNFLQNNRMRNALPSR